MTWREDLRRVAVGGRNLVAASFRGVPFFVQSADRAGGRRTVEHEFPYRDNPFVEDLGRVARKFRIEGYVVGDDYLTQKDKLLAALEDVEGPGELVHPYQGVLRAICTNVSLHDSQSDGGIATFSLEFTETPLQAVAPSIAVDTTGQVNDGADAAITATAAELAELYKPDGLPAYALASAEAAITKAAAALQAKLATVVAATQELAQLNSQVGLLTAEASSLVRDPALMIGMFRAAITSLTDTAEAAPGAVLDALSDAYGEDFGTAVDAITSTRARELANQNALVGALRRVLAVEAARLAPLATYVTIEEAIAARDRITAMLDEQAAAADDTAYPALVDLRSKVLRAVPGSATFARVVTVTRNVAVPSIVLAYQLYGDVTKELDIVARNNIQHPGFCAGELKVLSDDA